MRYALTRAREIHDLPTPEQEERIVKLWLERRWTSFEIAEFTGLHESVVDRVTHAARELVHQQYRELCHEG